MMPEYSGTAPRNLPVQTVNVPVTYQGKAVMTTAIMADRFVATEKQISDNFANNSDRFELGVHFYKLEGDELRDLKNRPDIIGLVGKQARSLMLWTKRGVSRHAKILNTDVAWEIYEELEETYFAVQEGRVPVHQVPQSLSQALRLAADQAETIEKQSALITSMEPKAEFHDQVASAVNAQPFMDVAKVFKTGRTRFTRWLRSRKFLQHHNRPYQEYEDAGYFRVVEKKRKDPDTGEIFTYPQTLITGKGITYLQRKWMEDHPDAQGSLQLEGK